MLWSVWWAWIGGAIALVILEILAPGYIFLGFAIGATAVGVLLALGASLSLPILLVIFGAVSLASWLGLRMAFGVRKGQTKKWDTDINEL
ncbi:NfeD family protein [Aliiroseovarius sp. S253]|uniref:NfeD family protein n=1 Tax=Aliiroseovarius sp. S253 TaxID=3415133 RepID=UPI003C7ED785